MAGRARDQAILAEQIKLLAQQSPSVILFPAVVAAVVLWVLWPYPESDHTWMLGWFAAIVTFAAVRGLAIFYFGRAPTIESNAETRALALAGFSAISGTLWGLAGWYLVNPDNLVSVVLIAIVLTGLVAGAAGALPAYLPAFAAYSIASMAPFGIRHFTFDGNIFLAIGFVTFWFLLVMLIYGRGNARMIRSSIELRFENLDLIERLRAERTRADEAREDAELSSEAKTRFLAAASHDMRQPLNAMGFFIEALLDDKLSKRSREIAENVRDSSFALGELLDGLLDFSKIEAGVLEPHLVAFPLSELLEPLGKTFDSLATNKGIKFRAVPCTAVVRSDRHMLRRILENLVSNAVRYTSKGCILLGCRRYGNRLSIEVHDTGPGIPEDMRDKIFREFYQLGNPERDRRKGLGLGLAVVAGLGKLLGHEVSVRSIPGIGSAFSVLVPLADPRDVDSPAVEGGRVIAPAAGATILVLDDDPNSCAAMAALMRRWGYIALEACTTAGALAAIHRAGQAPDALVVDYRLKGGTTGAEAIEMINEGLDPPRPAVIVTGDTDPARLTEAEASGHLLLHKPVQPARLRSALQHCLDDK